RPGCDPLATATRLRSTRDRDPAAIHSRPRPRPGCADSTAWAGYSTWSDYTNYFDFAGCASPDDYTGYDDCND
ncbi:MAG: hypothetical protein ACYSW8_32170, partial [Planctomycetota bacterium]